jgi:hypothetical protein
VVLVLAVPITGDLLVMLVEAVLLVLIIVLCTAILIVSGLTATLIVALRPVLGENGSAGKSKKGGDCRREYAL